MNADLPKHLLAIVGMAGSGKSEASKFFTQKGIPVLRLGDQTEIGLAERGLSITPENERLYREEIRRDPPHGLGKAAMAIKVVPRIEKLMQESNPSVVVLDGLYSWQELVYLQERYPAIHLVAIIADRQIRYARLAQRSVRPFTGEEARKRDMDEIEKLDKGGPIAIADTYILNNTSVANFYELLEDFYQKMLV